MPRPQHPCNPNEGDGQTESRRAVGAGRPGPFLRRVMLSCLCLILPSPADADEYLLGPQDRVRVKVYEWRASRDVIFEWSALNDVFTVGAEGRLALPFAGEVDAAGRTAEQVSAAIAESLMRNMGLGRQPDASVEVVDFRPVYILGDVAEPGAFPYRPGLTVLQALSIAGGLRVWEQDLARFRREIIQGRGDLIALALEKISLLARKARLEAELAGQDEITFPDELSSQADSSLAIRVKQQEELIFDARRQAISTQVRALEDLRRFLKQELASLTTQLGFLDKQIELIRKELGNVSSLVAKGLAPAPREMSLERTLAQIQSERLSAETGLLRTQQEISRTDVTILELRNQRANDVAFALRETQAQLDALARRTDTAMRLLRDSEATAPHLAASLAGIDASQARYTILRPGENGPDTLPAQEATPIKPGDTIKVEIPIPSGIEMPTGPAQAAGIDF